MTPLRFVSFCGALLCIGVLALPRPANAVLDIGDNGPVLDAGGFRMRVTNAGIVGNAFLDAGRSFDPSFEFPPYSAQELLNYASLWVGALDSQGLRRVSGGPLLEFRPTLDPDDRVRVIHRGDPGTLWRVDDDHDGTIDEEVFNGRDDDGDGLIDEDMGFTFDELMTAEYVDDRPEAVNFSYDTGESHVPLGLSVHQEVGAWSRVGFNKAAVLRYTITNHSTARIREIYVGLLADLDVKLREDRPGHLDDRVIEGAFSKRFNDGIGRNIIRVMGRVPPPPGALGPGPPLPCFSTEAFTGPVLIDGFSQSLPRITVVPMEHTTDPLGFIPPVASYARAPKAVSFRASVFSARGVSGQGGAPRLDADRYAALQGALPTNVEDRDDHVVLISCGPFAFLDPGQSIQFEAALVAAENADSLQAAVENVYYLHHGYLVNLLPDDVTKDSLEWKIGKSGRNGHEVCLDPPISFDWDVDCLGKFDPDGWPDPIPPPRHLVPGTCVWTDADCDECTGFRGLDTWLHWVDPGQVPPRPRVRLTPRDHDIEIAWDNTPEALLAGGRYGSSTSIFLGYRLYRLSDWRNRRGLLPPIDSWSLLRSFGSDSANGEVPLSAVLDSTVTPDGVVAGQDLYPPGRYRYHDHSAANGFDYVYSVTAVYELKVSGGPQGVEISILESPIVTSFDERVSPQAATHDRANGVWVVPNPFRASAGWDRTVTLGDPLPRHIDFMGLPPERSVIKIWTLAGDFVQRIDHDGRSGDGEAAWDLVTRNGQEVESGIYLFTVESSHGIQRGKFVVIR